MITYSQFIDEIRRLSAEALKLRDARQLHNDPKFREWRPDLESLLTQIGRAGYLLPNSVKVDMTPELRAEITALSRTPAPATDRLEELKTPKA